MSFRVRALLLAAVAGVLVAAVSCTNPFPENPVPYDTWVYETGDTGGIDSADSADTDPDS
jgi:hypothetical protein